MLARESKQFRMEDDETIQARESRFRRDDETSLALTQKEYLRVDPEMTDATTLQKLRLTQRQQFDLGFAEEEEQKNDLANTKKFITSESAISADPRPMQDDSLIDMRLNFSNKQIMEHNFQENSQLINQSLGLGLETLGISAVQPNEKVIS